MRHYWIIDPTARVLEAYRLGDDGLWVRVGAWDETMTARVEPFAAVELPVGRLFLPRAEVSVGQAIAHP